MVKTFEIAIKTKKFKPKQKNRHSTWIQRYKSVCRLDVMLTECIKEPVQFSKNQYLGHIFTERGLIIIYSVGTCKQNVFFFSFMIWFEYYHTFFPFLCVKMSHLSRWIYNLFIFNRILNKENNSISCESALHLSSINVYRFMVMIPFLW